MIIISHPASKGNKEKPLETHLLNVAEAASMSIQRLSLNIHLLTQEQLATLAYKIGLMHDLGKATSHFQHYIRGGARNNLTHHSYISSVITYYNFMGDKELSCFAPIAFKAVQKHHGNLSSFFNNHLDSNALIGETLSIYQNLSQQIKANQSFQTFMELYGITIPDLNPIVMKQFANVIDQFEPENGIEDAIELFLVQNLLFSVLTDADKHDAACITTEDNSTFIQALDYSTQKAVAGLPSAHSEINIIRAQFLCSIKENDSITQTNKLYSMTAPTGSGKTFACMEFTHKLQNALNEKRRVIYCLPYTSIIDQNFLEFEKVLKLNTEIPLASEYKYLLKHHHLVDYYQFKNDDPEYDYNDYLNDNLIADSWEAACVVSTFVQLFHSLIGSRNSMVRKLHNIINSIILMDEVQSLPAKYYPLIRAVFAVLAERFDTYLLTCTATQPYIYKPGSYVELCAQEFFNKPVFNRVKLSIISESHTIDSFCASVLNLDDVQSALLVMNTKRAAIALYKTICDRYQDSHEVLCLTTLHTPIHRQDTIYHISSLLRKGKKVILVSTQLVEAGVDLSFSRVYRDMGPMDSIVQVAGRCNRHGELGYLGGEMFLLNLHDDRGEYCQKVYDKYLLAKTRDCLKTYTIITSLQFSDLINAYYQSIDIGAEGYAVMKAISCLNYDQDINNQIPIKKFLLIENDYASETVYVLTDQTAEDAMQTILGSREALKDSTLATKQVSQLQLNMTRAYHVLTAYQLNLSMADCSKYSQEMLYFNKLTDHVYYIKNEYWESAYSRDTGFLLDPNDAGGCLAL